MTVAVPVQFVVGSRDLTGDYSDLSYSNVDPGGYEQLTATVSDATDLSPGDEVTVRIGLETAWHGRINELGPSDNDGVTTTQIAALGYGVKLTDKRIQMIYADRDLSRWGAPSAARKVSLIGSSTPQQQDAAVSPDTATGAPTVTTQIGDDWVSPWLPRCEAWYDAGDGCLIDSIYYAWTRGASIDNTNVSWDWRVYSATSDVTTNDDTGNLRAAGPGSGTFTPSADRRYALLILNYTATPAGGAGAVYPILWRPVVYGDHGLTKRGSSPQGFYPADIAGHALTHSGTGFVLVADDSSSLTVGHSVYLDPAPHQKVIGDMAILMGWHHGVWEPRTVLDSTPRMFFTAPPTTPTCVVARRDIERLEAPKIRVDRLYDTAKVRWTDPAGTTGIQTVTIANPLAAMAGVSGRVLDLDMGQGDATTATTFGTFALQLALSGARGGGSGTIPDSVILPTGGRKPASLLKSGRDRIRVLDLPDSGSLTARDADRYDSFLVRRVETTVKNERASTRVEFDGGADLLEVLQARLALSAFSDPSGSPRPFGVAGGTTH